MRIYFFHLVHLAPKPTDCSEQNLIIHLLHNLSQLAPNHKTEHNAHVVHTRHPGKCSIQQNIEKSLQEHYWQ